MPNTASSALLLMPLHRYRDAALLALRAGVGAFLVWGVADNLLNAERMAEFEGFLAHAGFPAPGVMAPLSVWAQFGVGVAFILGLLTRWAGLICAVNFIVAIAMVDIHGGIRAAFPSACLVLVGVYLAANGAGRFGLDRFVETRLGARGATETEN